MVQNSKIGLPKRQSQTASDMRDDDDGGLLMVCLTNISTDEVCVGHLCQGVGLKMNVIVAVNYFVE